MKDCPKCGSTSMGWVKDKEFDPETQTMNEGYFKCYICGKRVFEKEKND